jgi:hypothetical protein
MGMLPLEEHRVAELVHPVSAALERAAHPRELSRASQNVTCGP